jgi:hypothetical protein
MAGSLRFLWNRLLDCEKAEYLATGRSIWRKELRSYFFHSFASLSRKKIGMKRAEDWTEGKGCHGRPARRKGKGAARPRVHARPCPASAPPWPWESIFNEDSEQEIPMNTIINDRAELELFRAQVNCAALLERHGWQLDAKESTRRALKYRRHPGEILIVTHDGRGWWDPLSDAKGDIFNLVQHFEPDLNFGHVRKVLRQLVGIAPRQGPFERERRSAPATADIEARWSRRPRLSPASEAWRYLERCRAIPATVLDLAGAQDAIRAGAYGSAWFAHRDQGRVTHVEIRGPDYKGSLRDGDKTLFRFKPAPGPVRRLVIAEGAIDALSVAAREPGRSDTLYAAGGGGIGPGTLAALTALCAELATRPGSVLVSATDANLAGDRYANRHAELADAAGIGFQRLRPPEGRDWNDVLQGRGA